MKTIHKIDGGEIIDRKCLKCGKKWNLISYSFSGSVVEEEVKFDPKEYRQRIRRGEDIFKNR